MPHLPERVLLRAFRRRDESGRIHYIAASLAQYLAERLAAQIRERGDNYRIEGATLSRTHLGEMWFKVPGGRDFRNSNAEAGYDLSMFRLR